MPVAVHDVHLAVCARLYRDRSIETHLGLDLLRGEIQLLFELRICRQVFSLDVELLDAMVQRVHDVKIVIGVESYSGRPVLFSFGAAKLPEAVKKLSGRAIDVNPVGVFFGEEQVAAVAERDVGDPDELAFGFPPTAELAQVIAFLKCTWLCARPPVDWDYLGWRRKWCHPGLWCWTNQSPPWTSRSGPRS